MSEPIPLEDDLFSALKDLAFCLREFPGKASIIGGIATVFLGRPRTTRDIDALFWLLDEEVSGLIEVAKSFNYEPRIEDALEFALENRVLLMRHVSTFVEADFALGMLSFEQELVERTQNRDLGGFSLPFPTPEDLIITKAVAGRPRDLSDIEGIIDNNQQLDKRRIRLVVGEMAHLLESPDILENLERLLK
jgi:hypothetical protein